MSNKLILTGLTVIVAIPAVLSRDLIPMIGGVVMIVGAVLLWLNQ